MSNPSQSVMVVNCGSSSIKLALYSSEDSVTPCITALGQRLGSDSASLSIKGDVQFSSQGNLSHQEALSLFIEQCATFINNVVGIGHRVVHGGETFSESILLDTQTYDTLKTLNELAPLHNPINLMGIKLCEELLPNIPNVAVFDTAFHQTLAPEVYLYAVPYQWYTDYGVRRYGFHGTSFRYLTDAAAERLQRPKQDLNILIAHLGNGCSACAIRQGISVDTTMGLTPLEGLVMGTRSGDIGAGVLGHVAAINDHSITEMLATLNKESGLLGLSSGFSNDMRTLLQAESEGDISAARAIDVFCFRAARHLAALSVNLPSIDAIVFSGGIGEHSAQVRQRIMRHWQSALVTIDDELNEQHGNEIGQISRNEPTNSSNDQPKLPVILVIATDEEKMIAADTYQIISSSFSNHKARS
ncbi:MAG: acetate/propionate family kinase [Oleibacter sp.]|nr:acetate/propionate family kinase [Thalassolituus sp.]